VASWFGEQEAAGNPILVAETAGAVVGYVTWTWFRGGPRFRGYRHTRELTIHVDGHRHGRGVGRALIDTLVDRARSSDVRVLVAGVDAENSASIEFHRRLGFTKVAQMPEVGRKSDRWLDLVLLQRIFDSGCGVTRSVRRSSTFSRTPNRSSSW
jgi:L-amino acid N-acyltransferase YncA